MSNKIWKPEILAPVGEARCLEAAVAGGADAVYMGLRHFNARGRAANFRLVDLPRQVGYLHHHGLKCYIVFNTLLHDDEFEKAEKMARAALAAGVDAAIIQDLGLWTLLRARVPDLELHASTQMTVHSPEQVRVLAELGAQRVILARELSLPEVEACTVRAQELGIETEHFVHGALCYAWSGQCLMSNFAGCRSANRGTCAQNCRYDYTTVGQSRESMISMKDFSLIDRIAELSDIGVASLKIEGRLKGPEYVYTVCNAYRTAVDAWAEQKTFSSKKAKKNLQGVFSRGFTNGLLDGVYDDSTRLQKYTQDMGRQPDAQLVSLERRSGLACIRTKEKPTAGQGYVFYHENEQDGFLITSVDKENNDVWWCNVRVADRGVCPEEEINLFLNSDHKHKEQAEKAMAQVRFDEYRTGSIALDITCIAQLGSVFRMIARSADGRCVECLSDHVVERAHKPQAKEAFSQTVTKAVGSCGGSDFYVKTLTLACDDNIFLPASVIKKLRRAVLKQLSETDSEDLIVPTQVATTDKIISQQQRQTELWVAVGSINAARAALDAGAARVWLDDPAMSLWGTRCPTIPHIDNLWLRHPATAPVSPWLEEWYIPLVAGHIGVIEVAQNLGIPVVADHYCNVVNTKTLQALEDIGAEAAVISLECSAREVGKFAHRYAGGCGMALTVHGRLPAMITRQNHNLQAGESRVITATQQDGGLPYVMQRHACGDTTLYEGRVLCAPEHAVKTVGLVDAWLLELADQTPEQVAELTNLYASLCDGSGEPARIYEKTHAPLGVFSGHLAIGSRALDEQDEAE